MKVVQIPELHTSTCLYIKENYCFDVEILYVKINNSYKTFVNIKAIAEMRLLN